MLWTYIRTHSNDEPRCGETSPLLSAAGRSQCPSDEEVKLIRRPPHATAVVVLSKTAGEIQCICKAPARIVAAGQTMVRACKQRGNGSCAESAIHELRGRGYPCSGLGTLCPPTVHRGTARRDRRVTLPPETVFSRTLTISIPLVISPAIRCKPLRSCIASIPSSGATANLTCGGI